LKTVVLPDWGSPIMPRRMGFPVFEKINGIIARGKGGHRSAE
jgi:hypothetical protein